MITAGKFTMYLDEGEVDLVPGDMVLQRNTMHSWMRHGYKGPCSFAGVIIRIA